MPSQIAHILHGRAVLASTKLPWSGRQAEIAFHLGCQGPDLFYHNRRTKPGAFLYGTRLHRRGWGTVLARFRREALDRNWGPEHPGLAFLAGQATHGFLDRRAHPFVVYFSGWKIPQDSATDVLRHAHAFFERILDVLLWEELRGTPLRDCPWQEDLPTVESFPADFWTAWAEALHEVFPQLSARADVEDRLKNAISDTRGFLAFTAPSARDHALRAARHGAIHYFHPEALPDWDFLNRAHRPWLDPVTGRSRSESFLDLFEQAVADAVPPVAGLTDPHCDWETLIGNTSLNLVTETGEIGTPQFSRPWDFATLYDREVQARLSRSS